MVSGSAHPVAVASATKAGLGIRLGTAWMTEL